ncbi:MAG: hypothetical protein WAX79_01710 [Candidatus Omnitrophota bacterium]
MSEPIILTKLADISFTTLTKSTSSVVKGLLVLGLLFFLLFGIKSCIKKPNPTQIQTAEKIDNKNFYLQPRAFGCARLIVQPDKK